MNLKKRIIAFAELGKIFRGANQNALPKVLLSAMESASRTNQWFVKENIVLALDSLGKMLEEDRLTQWLSAYNGLEKSNTKPKQVGVIMAGNIPLVGFHDFLCVLMSNHSLVAKLSSNDTFLLPAIAQLLIEIESGFKDRIQFASTLTISDSKPNEKNKIAAFIATGSNNSAKHFEYYFRKHPHIIRKNRNSAGIIRGDESEEELKKLGEDVFHYFGMGCRNVSKIFVPKGFKLDRFFSAIVDFGDIIHHNKYANNYHYYRSIYLLSTEKFLDNNFIMFKESANVAAPTGTLLYEEYENELSLYQRLANLQEQIQCIASQAPLSPALEKIRVAFGNTQEPALWEYADGVDTMQFLTELE